MILSWMLEMYLWQWIQKPLHGGTHGLIDFSMAVMDPEQLLPSFLTCAIISVQKYVPLHFIIISVNIMTFFHPQTFRASGIVNKINGNRHFSYGSQVHNSQPLDVWDGNISDVFSSYCSSGFLPSLSSCLTLFSFTLNKTAPIILQQPYTWNIELRNQRILNSYKFCVSLILLKQL